MGTQEKKVGRFYSTGLIRIKDMQKYSKSIQKEKGFLSFGYWNKCTKTYLDAATNLLQYFIENSDIKNATRILNVACGNGTEAFSYFYEFRPKAIDVVDITKLHVDYANHMAQKLKLDKEIKFYQCDACALNFPENAFSHIIGIEGPVHFNTRDKFFNSAKKILKKEGELLLTDIIIGEKFNKRNIFQEAIVELIRKKWVVPEANQVDEMMYKNQLKGAGFKVIFFKKIGKNVFPGYAKNSCSIKTIVNRILQRGFMATIGLTIISYALGYLYKKGLLEYIYVKAQI